jgi:hypothetical protein
LSPFDGLERVDWVAIVGEISWTAVAILFAWLVVALVPFAVTVLTGRREHERMRAQVRKTVFASGERHCACLAGRHCSTGHAFALPGGMTGGGHCAGGDRAGDPGRHCSRC